MLGEVGRDFEDLTNGTGELCCGVEVPVGFTPSLAFNDFGSGFPSIAYFDISSNLMFVEDPPAPGDLDGDGTIGVADLLWLLGDWGLSHSPADLNQDGRVDVLDLLMLLSNWG